MRGQPIGAAPKSLGAGFSSIVGTLRALGARIRDGIDGHLHARRRRRARARIAATLPDSVVFVCLGNICRSPFAARLWASHVSSIEASSAGFIGPGRPPPEEALSAACAWGLDHADHRSRIATAEITRGADVVFVFDRYHVKMLSKHGHGTERVFWLGDFDPEWAGKRAIPDPWGKPEAEFERTFERIARCVNDVQDALGVRDSESTRSTP